MAANNNNGNLGANLVSTGDAIYSAAFTYDFLEGINTLGTHRPKQINIPKRSLDKMTGMERQYWDIKSKYFDVVLFFKKGKFYELYDCDAVIGNREFGLKMTGDSGNRGKMRMSGVPEKSFAEWSRLFVFKGYKVGKVEQMEVTDAMIAANGGKDLKCMPRELTVILSRGTMTEGNAIGGPEAIFVVGICPKQQQRSSQQQSSSSSGNNNNNNNNAANIEQQFVYDAVAIDLSRQCYFYCPCENITELVTLLHHLTPKEILLPNSSNNNSNANQQQQQEKNPNETILAMLSHVVADLLPDSHIERVAQNTNNNNTNNLPDSWHLVFNYFSYLKIDADRLLPSRFETSNMFDDGSTSSGKKKDDANNNTNNDDRSANPLSFVLYSQHKRYSDELPPVNINESVKDEKILNIERRNDPGMALDSAAIECLDLVVNSRDGSSNSTILSWLTAERACLPSSQRMIRDWLLRPSSNQDVISARQDAVKLIFEPPQEFRSFVSGWNQLVEKKGTSNASFSKNNTSAITAADDDDDDDETGGAGANNNKAGGGRSCSFYDISLSQTDFERILSRISDFKSEDTRVSFTEPLVHYHKNIFNIHQAIQGFEQLLSFYGNADKVLKDFIAKNSSDGAKKTRLLRELIETIGAIRQPINEVLKKFPRQRIERDGGLLLPLPGENAEYDTAQALIAKHEKTIQDKRAEFISKLGDNSLKYVNIGKDLFLLELPTKLATAANLKAHGLAERARTQKTVKCSVAALSSTIEAHKKATTARENAINATLRDVASTLCESWHFLFSASRAASYLDCLFGLANVARQQSCRSEICFPSFEDSPILDVKPQLKGSQTSLELKQAYHPLLLLLGRKCVPNDICLGGYDDQSNDDTIQRTFILTGPNMAGKSTLMRTVAVNVILAQIGCPVCARSMRVIGAPCDRVFTRIGAKDATHRGQSTLFVELSETATILKEATGRSLCLLDELGRGTSTHDGYAIAHACLRAVAGIDVIEDETTQLTTTQLMEQFHKLPLVLFATHYHALALEIHQKTGIAATRCQQGYMMFGSERRQRDSNSTNNNNNNTQEQQQLDDNVSPGSSASVDSEVRTDVQFLYKLAPGICARSYGAEVALQAGLSRNVVERARMISRKMALTSADFQLSDFRRFMQISVEQIERARAKGEEIDEATLINKVKTRAAQLIALASSAHSAAY